ncbi:UDP-N-acetylmuramate dehydrogenase [Alphaproteobacteria bacterium]|nr:UDP-N-acetylmuramate dehydrogenase [Alphaproteobacteria bacterium]
MSETKLPSDIQQTAPEWLSALPEVRGSYKYQFTMADICWFRVGGAADVVFSPADADDLSSFLAHLPSDIPLHILGAGSNTLVRDGGLRGVVLRLGSSFGKVEQIGERRLKAGAAALDVRVSRMAADASLSGLEFFRGIPGAIGGAIAMNAGAYGGETAERLHHVEAFTRQGQRLELTPAELGLSYRHNSYDDFLVYTGAYFDAVPGDQEKIRAAMQDISDKRETTQPIKSRTGGSTFKNPKGTDPDGPKSWQLIDAAGCRGMRIGDAQVSELHCNFLINHGKASAADLENLGETVREKVRQSSGIDLHWEIKRIGEAGHE